MKALSHHFNLTTTNLNPKNSMTSMIHLIVKVCRSKSRNGEMSAFKNLSNSQQTWIFIKTLYRTNSKKGSLLACRKIPTIKWSICIFQRSQLRNVKKSPYRKSSLNLQLEKWSQNLCLIRGLIQFDPSLIKLKKQSKRNHKSKNLIWGRNRRNLASNFKSHRHRN